MSAAKRLPGWVCERAGLTSSQKMGNRERGIRAMGSRTKGSSERDAPWACRVAVSCGAGNRMKVAQ